MPARIFPCLVAGVFLLSASVQPLSLAQETRLGDFSAIYREVLGRIQQSEGEQGGSSPESPAGQKQKDEFGFPAANTRFRVESSLVNLIVGVMDEDENPVGALTAENFIVEDCDKKGKNCRRVQLTHFARPDASPVKIAVVVEVSPATRLVLFGCDPRSYQYCTNSSPGIIDSLGYLLMRVKAKDWVALLTYGEKLNLKVDFTHDKQGLVMGFRAILEEAYQTLYHSAFALKYYDSMAELMERFKGLEQLDRQRLAEPESQDTLGFEAFQQGLNKYAVIVIGTGLDGKELLSWVPTMPSLLDWDDFEKKIKEYSVPIYFIDPTFFLRNILDNPRYAMNHDINMARMDLNIAAAQMQEVAKLSGGQVFQPRFFQDLNSIYDRVVNVINGQYSLGYPLPDGIEDGESRRIKVEVVGSDVKIKAFHRSGYVKGAQKASQEAIAPPEVDEEGRAIEEEKRLEIQQQIQKQTQDKLQEAFRLDKELRDLRQQKAAVEEKLEFVKLQAKKLDKKDPQRQALETQKRELETQKNILKDQIVAKENELESALREAKGG
ncbi:MAG: hypothetical protein HY402_06075 [Elusimicrobia bacterium]|nr:hypothetical protein [Elusimicrobiota bacterium]